MALTRQRNRSLIRALGIIRRLQAARIGVTIPQLAGETGVSQRTIRRDLEAVQCAGVPLVDERGDDGCKRWRVADWRQEVA